MENYPKGSVFMALFRTFLLTCLALSMAFASPAQAEDKAPSRGRILFLMSSHDELFGTGKKTGVWLDSVAMPYYLLKEAGYDITLASMQGLRPPIDPRSQQDMTPAAKRFLADKDAMKQFSDTLPFSEIKPEDYIALYLPESHGAMWDMADIPEVTILVTAFAQNKKIIAAVGHAPIALMNAGAADGKGLTQGHRVAAFTKAEEVQLGTDNSVPVYADYSMEKVGGKVVRGAPFKPNAQQDGLLITGQNPQSTEKVARLMLAALKKQQKQK